MFESLIKDKKAGERLSFFYWIVIFIIVSIAIASAVIVFYSASFDVRGIEAEILSDKIIECMVDNGELQGVEGDLQEKCNLNFQDDTGKYKEEQYYIEAEVNGKKISSGNKVLEPFCSESSKKNIPYCLEKKLMVLDSGNFVLLKIKSVVRKIEQNAAK